MSGLMGYAQSSQNYIEVTPAKDFSGKIKFRLSAKSEYQVEGATFESKGWDGKSLTYVPTAEKVRIVGDVILFKSETLSAIDLGHTQVLDSLIVSDSKLTELDLKVNKSIRYLDAQFLSLERIDLSGCAKLEEADLSFGDKLVEVKLNGCVGLRKLKLTKCIVLPQIDLQDCENLERLMLISSPLTKLDLTKNTKLKSFDCTFSKIEELPIDHLNDLEWFDCSSSPVKGIVLSNKSNLTKVVATSCALSQLKLTNCPLLKEVYVQKNNL